MVGSPHTTMGDEEIMTAIGTTFVLQEGLNLFTENANSPNITLFVRQQSRTNVFIP